MKIIFLILFFTLNAHSKLYIIESNEKYATVRANHLPVGYITDKIENETTDIDILDIVDDLDEQGEIVGKKAVISQTKLEAKNLDRAKQKTLETSKARIKLDRLKRIKEACPNMVAPFKDICDHIANGD